MDSPNRYIPLQPCRACRAHGDMDMLVLDSAWLVVLCRFQSSLSIREMRNPAVALDPFPDLLAQKVF